MSTELGCPCHQRPCQPKQASGNEYLTHDDVFDELELKVSYGNRLHSGKRL